MRKQQQGYIIIIAIVFIFVMGVMGTLVAYMFSNRARVSAAVYQGMQAFYIAESGLEATMRTMAMPGGISCSSVTGHAYLTNSPLFSGQFTATGLSTSGITTLNGAINASATSLTLTSAAGFASEGVIRVDREAIQYASVSGNVLLGLTRGVDFTTPSSHASGAPVGQFQCAIHVTGAVPTMATPNYQRDIAVSMQMQDGWVVGDRDGNDYSLFRWGGGSEANWTDEKIPSGGAAYRANLNDIDMLSNVDGWAVGDRATNGFVLLHWNGTAWTPNLLAGACPNQDLYGVSMVSSNEGWAVGLRYKPGCGGGKKNRYTILKWNGSSWGLLTPSTSPNIPADHKNNQDLTDVDMFDSTGSGYADLGFAVGDSGTILQFNGSSWVAVTSPVTSDLFGVSIVSTSEAWAVGNNGVILRWNGSSWSSFSSPTPTPLNDIDMYDTDNDGLAEFGVAIGDAGRVLIYNGSSWSSSTVSSNNLEAVHVLNENDAWAAGANGRIAHWDGATWATTSVTRQLNGISMIGSQTGKFSGWTQIFH